jgi:hypothetical protein
MRLETIWIATAVIVFGLAVTAYMFMPRPAPVEVYERQGTEPPVAPQVYEEGVMYKG